ncbi:MAG TPA: hypothetical protein VHS78_17915 [Candidatus Elarobacter sp.]|jgi:photosystem II stability/assembly factor-like uncharacterized protein|nr:hypothetical protein [Candidatus Elarobacter sp.]
MRCRKRLTPVLRIAVVSALLAVLAIPIATPAQTARAIDPSLYSGMRWRMIGPFRGGRAVAVSGVAGDPRTFYFGAVGGGVWKTENAGRTWNPIMDSQPVASIGALAVAPSDPNTVYAGSGEADMRSDIQHGNGMYRSTDAGKTWTRTGLEDSRQIGRILVDPRDPKTLLVAALGHQYGPNEVRGVYRSTDGGATWTRTLFHDRDTGAIDLASDPSMRTVYASLWQTRRPPWSVYPPSNGPGSGLYKSTDGGATWTQLHGNGFPSESLGKIGLAVAPSDPNRVYAIVDAKAGGLYRSDDAGASWKLVDKDTRIWQRGWYFCHVAVDPKNADVVYISDTAFYRSTNGGASFTAIKGSPDGDDFHGIWIDPTEPSRIVLGSDQGASVSIDGARTWSSWFNQPTAQFYNVRADNAFPYRLYGAQQDSGAAMIASRSSHKGIQERDWRPINAGGESGSVAPDPADANVVYGNNPVLREDTGIAQTQLLAPTTGLPGVWREEWTQPMSFGRDRALYTANQYVYRTRDGGKHWQRISNDLTRAHPGVPATLDAPAAKDVSGGGEARGLVYSLAPSPVRADLLWAGTDDGLVHLTRDGGRTWRNVTPPAMTSWTHVDAIEASHFDPQTAYAAVDRHRLDDDRPYIYVTHDGGRTWHAAMNGIAADDFVYVVREDPKRRGLLYAGTEHGVYASFDDGASWRSLRLNMPVVSVHDLIVHDDDLAIATHGRAFWILDDVEPLRQLAAGPPNGAWLFAPRAAVRLRPYNDEAEASPPETPLGENPPYGALIDYIVPPGTSGPVQLSIADASGTMLRTWSSADAPATTDPNTVDYPAYWLVTPQRPSAQPGMHRFAWDFHAAGSATGRRRRGGAGPLVPPGRYTVGLTAGGRTMTQPIVIRRDPRLHATDADLRAQYALAREIDALLARVQAAVAESVEARKKPGANLTQTDAIAGAPPSSDPRNSVGTPATTFTTLRWYASALGDLFDSVESADTAPTTDQRTRWTTLHADAQRALQHWSTVPK